MLFTITRGVTRLDGARGKKQVWRPHVRTWRLKHTVLKKVLVTLLGLFGALCSHSVHPSVSAPHSDLAPGELCPLSPLVTPLTVRATGTALSINHRTKQNTDWWKLHWFLMFHILIWELKLLGGFPQYPPCGDGINFGPLCRQYGKFADVFLIRIIAHSG